MQHCDVIIALSDLETISEIRTLVVFCNANLEVISVCSTGEDLVHAMSARSQARIVFLEYTFLQSEYLRPSTHEKLILVEEKPDFEHLLTALRQGGIFDCLCLPLEMREFCDSVNRALEQLEWSKNSNYIEPNSASRQIFWRNIHKISISSMTISQINRDYGTRFVEGLFSGLFIELKSSGNQTLVFQNEEMQDFAMRLCNKDLQTECFDILFNRHTNGVSALINFSFSKREKIFQLIDKLFFDLRREFREIYHVCATMSVSRSYSEVCMLLEIKNEILDARWYRKFTGSNEIIQAEEVEKKGALTPKQQRDFQNLWELIVHYYEILDVDGAVSCIRRFLNFFQKILPVRQFRVYSRQLLTLFFEIYENELLVYGDRDMLLQKYIHREVSAANNVQLEKVLIDNVTDLMQKVSRVIQHQYTQPVRDCIAYIARHYMENIRLGELADSIGLSPQYLSNLFHSETGRTISEYIAIQKLNAAQSMLKYTDKKVNEIADALGFEDAHYFSKFFKKHMNITPKEYRLIENAKEAVKE